MEVNRENLSIFLNENVQQVDQAIVLSSSTLMAIVCEHFGVPNSTSIQTMVGCSIRQLFPLAKKGRGHYKFLRLIESSVSFLFEPIECFFFQSITIKLIFNFKY